jgi:hypothetical protein
LQVLPTWTRSWKLCVPNDSLEVDWNWSTSRRAGGEMFATGVAWSPCPPLGHRGRLDAR